MRVLVTGSRGFLGAHVVAALSARGHRVRGLDRSGPARPAPGWRPDEVDHVVADLCSAPGLGSACQGAEVVVHLAARLHGPAPEVVAAAVDGTRRLLVAAKECGVAHLVLASSLSVYDWCAADGVLDEGSPQERRPERRDAYTEAKLRQEEVAREGCERAGMALTVMRPAVLWGLGREMPPTLGPRLGRLQVVVEGGRQLPLLHVENGADAFAVAAGAPASGWRAFNVVDHPEVTAMGFFRDRAARMGGRDLPIPVGYGVGRVGIGVARALVPPGLRGGLPALASPERFAARFRPLRVPGRAFRAVFGWSPPLPYDRCLDRTFGPTGDRDAAR